MIPTSLISRRFAAVRMLVVALLLLASRNLPAAEPAPALELRDGDRVALIGDTLIEREQYHGWIELMLTTRFADRHVVFRNLGWSADTPGGASRLGLSLLQAGREPAGEAWSLFEAQLTEVRPTVALIGYGMANSFDGEAGLAAFRHEYARLLDTLQRIAPGIRIVLLGPIDHEALGEPWPDPAAHQAQLVRYADAVRELAAGRRLPFVPLAGLQAAGGAIAGRRLTDNGIHLSDAGYRAAAERIEATLFSTAVESAPPWRTSPRAEPLRQAIVRKNEWFFHRSRPANMAYIFGFRKREQGRNAAEVPQFDALIAAEEGRIARLRGLAPVNVPPIPFRAGGSSAANTPQPAPSFQVDDALEVTLWAQNPQLHKPIHMNFDPRGRLWVVSSEVYPQIEPGQQPTDKVIVLEDTTGAGRADKATVFADGLLIPTGIEIGDGGAYVAQSTDLLHLRDRDGDGRADERRIVLSGFGTEDTHHNLHTLRWGPDGRMYLHQSVYTRTHTETPHGVVRLNAGGVFRFAPQDQRFEILYRGWINSWGLHFDAFGEAFVTDGAGAEGVSWGVSGATYRTLAPARKVLGGISPGSYPKFCGIEVLRSPQFPAEWQGDVITADFRAHRVVRFKLADDGAGFVTREMPDLLRSTDNTFRPVDVKQGPDGALYIADWSNPIIQHGEVDFRDPRRDKVHGRIWRIAARGRPALARVDYPTRPTAELLDTLVSGNAFAEERARRVLLERGAAAVQPELAAWLARQTDARAGLQALWLNQAFGDIPTALLERQLGAEDPRVRAAAVRAMPRDAAAPARLERLVRDSHPRVRLEAVRALGGLGTARAAELALATLDGTTDRFLEHAVWLTVNELARPWLAAVQDGTWRIEGRERQLEFALDAIEPELASEVLGQLLQRRPLTADGAGPWIELIGKSGGRAEVAALLRRAQAGGFETPALVRALQAATLAARQRDMRAEIETAGVRGWLADGREPVRLAAAEMAGAYRLTAVLPELLAVVRNPQAAAPVRAACLAAVREIGGDAAKRGLRAVFEGESRPEVRREALVAYAALDIEAAVPLAVAELQRTADEAAAEALWRGLLGVGGAGPLFAQALGDATLPEPAARAGLRPAREGNRQPGLVAVLLKLSGQAVRAGASPEDFKQIATAAARRGDPRRGELVYRRPELACVACHAIGGIGGKVGPDLTSIGASAPADYLVEALYEPNAKIKEGYHAVSLALRDGRELSGMVEREDPGEIRLRDASGEVTTIVPRDVVRRTNIGSLMPGGLIDGLVPDERDDLVAFLTQLGKPGDFDASQSGVARAWQLFLRTSRTQTIGTDRLVAADRTIEGWVPAASLVNGRLPWTEIEQAAGQDNWLRGLFAATRFRREAAGPVELALLGSEHVVGAWLNGEPVNVGPQLIAAARAGENVLVLQLDQRRPPEAIAVRAPGVAFATE